MYYYILGCGIACLVLFGINSICLLYTSDAADE